MPDHIKISVITEGLQLHVAETIDLYMNRQRDQIKQIIEQEMESIDFRDVIRRQVQQQASKAINETIQGAFRIDWDVEKQLRQAVAKMFIEKFKVDKLQLEE